MYFEFITNLFMKYIYEKKKIGLFAVQKPNVDKATCLIMFYFKSEDDYS